MRIHPPDRRMWRLIDDLNPENGAWNMAADEFLFSTLTDDPQTVLRFYMWKQPTASLGYSQKIERVLDKEFCRSHGVDVVRRMTGGKLVLHHREITYSLCSSDTGVFTDTLAGSYRIISLGLMRGLELMGLKPSLADAPPADYARGALPCFSYPARNEVEVEGKKIIGSAQKRVGGRFIQHGSIPIGDDEELLKKVSFLEPEEDNVRLMPLSEALGREISPREALDFFLQGLSDFFRIGFLSLPFSDREREEIAALRKKKYARDEWTQLR